MTDNLGKIIDGIVQIVLAAMAGGGTASFFSFRHSKKSNKKQSEIAVEQTQDLKIFVGEKFDKVDTRLSRLEKSHIETEINQKKAMISSLIRERDNAIEETRPWIDEKIAYEANIYFKLGGNSYISDDLDKRNIHYDRKVRKNGEFND